MTKRTILLAALVLGLAPAEGSEDVRYRPPGHWMIPGILEGEFSGDVVTNVLPDVITATVRIRVPERSVRSRVPERTVRKR